MNQPKFKFGDKVFLPGADPWEVRRVEFIVNNSDGSGEFKYNGGFWESEMYLYQEPKKKKLYAYSMEDGKVDHFKTEQQGYDYYVSHCYKAKRDPDYDIEYPENLK